MTTQMSVPHKYPKPKRSHFVEHQKTFQMGLRCLRKTFNQWRKEKSINKQEEIKDRSTNYATASECFVLKSQGIS